MKDKYRSRYERRNRSNSLINYYLYNEQNYRILYHFYIKEFRRTLRYKKNKKQYKEGYKKSSRAYNIKEDSLFDLDFIDESLVKIQLN